MSVSQEGSDGGPQRLRMRSSREGVNVNLRYPHDAC